MTKAEFLNELKNRIAEYPSEETNQSVEYYSEMIDDRMEDGMSEAEAVASMGKVAEIAQQIKEELPLTTLVKYKTKEKTKGKRLPVWAIILLILGFPLWGGLGITILSVVLALYAVVWSIDLAIWSLVLAFACCGLIGVVGFIGSLVQGAVGSALVYLGGGLAGVGLGVFLFIGILLLTKGLCHGTGWCFRQLKKAIIG